jgi:hypothetical protein
MGFASVTGPVGRTRWLYPSYELVDRLNPSSRRITDTSMVASKQKLHVDGSKFSTLEGFCDHVSLRIIPGAEWGRNLDAFDDILRGDFGTPEEGFILCWDNHEISKRNLGYVETARQLRKRLERCHPSNTASVEHDLAQALKNEGPTVFDWLVEIIQRHCPGGDEAADGVELILR